MFLIFELLSLKVFLICSFFYQFQPRRSYKVCSYMYKGVFSVEITASHKLRYIYFRYLMVF